MARSVNKVFLVGNLTRDPEIRTTQHGKRIANLSLATSEVWKDKQTGEKKEQTEFHKVVVFSDGLAGIIEQYTRKGSKLHIEGKLVTRKWQDQSGQDRYSTEIVVDQFNGDIVLCDRAGGGQSDQPHRQQDTQMKQESPRQEPQRQAPQRQNEPAPDWDDSDIPF